MMGRAAALGVLPDWGRALRQFWRPQCEGERNRVVSLSLPHARPPNFSTFPTRCRPWTLPTSSLPCQLDPRQRWRRLSRRTLRSSSIDSNRPANPVLNRVCLRLSLCSTRLRPMMALMQATVTTLRSTTSTIPTSERARCPRAAGTH